MPEAPTCHILLVDDDADIRATLTLILASRGYRVVSAANGQQALEQLQAGVSPKLVVLDLMMPAMNGAQFLAELDRTPGLARPRVLAISGDRGLDLKAAAAGADDFLRKPFDMTSFLDKVRQLCEPAG